MKDLILVAALLMLVAGCGGGGKVGEPTEFGRALAALDDRPVWQTWGPTDLPRHPWEQALAGKTIVLDPGHGGRGDEPGYKRGPTGLREADVNLRVAIFLERLLVDAGAEVILTRRADVDLDLPARAAIANAAHADLFISLHHNAAGSGANYTTVWYHGDAEAAGSSADIAMYVATEIGDALRTEAAKTSPTMSDLQMYDTGFGVLRAADVPAILTESSFYTNADEEQRLADPWYNLREAYATYRGLCGYFRHGVPGVDLSLAGSQLTATLDEDLPDWWGHERRGPLDVSVTVDGNAIAFDRTDATVTADVGDHGDVIVRFRNAFGHTGVGIIERANDQPDAPRAAASATPNDMAPWTDMPTVAFPVKLVDLGNSGALDHGLDLPAGSALTVVKIVDGELRARRWYDSGELGFYPASTVKLVTAVMLLDRLDKLGVTVDGDIQLGDEPRTSIAETLTVMIRDSGNEEFNTLQESVGFAETDAWLKSIGVETGVIRRHFTRPHWNSSRPVKLWDADGKLVADLPARPAVDFPPNAAGGESNWFHTDDLIRVMAATMKGPVRDKSGFDVLAAALRDSGGKFLGDQLPPRYAVYNKVGWWPPDGAYSDVAYIHDTQTDSHYYLAAYCNGIVEHEDYEPEEPRQILGTAAARVMEMIDEGKLMF